MFTYKLTGDFYTALDFQGGYLKLIDKQGLLDKINSIPDTEGAQENLLKQNRELLDKLEPLFSENFKDYEIAVCAGCILAIDYPQNIMRLLKKLGDDIFVSTSVTRLYPSKVEVLIPEADVIVAAKLAV